MSKSYYEKKQIDGLVKLRKVTKELPPFIAEFFRGIASTTSINTQIVYAYDLKIFFNYLILEEKEFWYDSILQFTIEDLSKLNINHLENFIDYLGYYIKEDGEKVSEITNGEKGKNRKISTLRSMFWYYFKRGKIPSNPAELIDLPKVHDKNIVTLDVHEIVLLLEEVESGNKLTKKQKDYHKYTKKRDLALIILLLGTGMRISECVGINIDDIDFSINGVKITRKGGNESVVYFNEEVRESLLAYLEDRNIMDALEGHEQALFLSMQKKRMSSRSIQILVKKYSTIVTPLKTITPHKLRSTYGTQLYRESGDIYLVADALGHKDVNTTKKHYAKIDDDRRKMAAKYVNLRKS